MNEKINSVWKRLRDGGVLNAFSIGNFATPRIVDHVCRSGQFDVIWFDLEHFDIPVRQLAVLNMVTRGYPVATIARFKATDYQAVMRVLEAGVDGIMCSMVEDDQEARRVVKWAKFPLLDASSGMAGGNRGWNGGGIDGAYGSLPAGEYIRYQNTQTMVLLQIEHNQALEKARQIVATPGVDGLFFGPADYAASVGVPGQLTHPVVWDAMKTVSAAAEAEGKWWGTLGIGPEMYGRVRELGARLIGAGGDLRVMNLGLREVVKTFEGFAREPASGEEGGK